MWEAIGTVLSSANGIKTELIILITLVLVVVAARLNIISISGKWLKVGKIKDDERAILRLQLSWMTSYMNLQFEEVYEEGMDYYRTKYIISKVQDFFEQIIIFNHITLEPTYLETKRQQLYSMVLGLTTLDKFRTKEGKEYIYQLSDKCIHTLYEIRNGDKK